MQGEMSANMSIGTIVKSDKQNISAKIFETLHVIVPILLGVLLFFNPFPHTTAIKEFSFYVSVVIVVILILFRKIEFSLKSPLTLPFVLFTVWAFIGIFFALDKENSIHDFMTHLVKYIVMYFIVMNFFKSRKNLTYLSSIIIISTALFSAVEFFYFYVISGESFSTKLVTGLPEIPVNWVGYLTVTATIFGLHQVITKDNNIYITIVYTVSLCSLTVLTFLTQTRSSLAALFLSVIILCYDRKKFLFLLLGILIIITLISPIQKRFFHANLITSLRLDIHSTTFEIIKDFPIFGIGFGMETYRNGDVIDLEAYNRKVPEKFRQPAIHNDPHSMLTSIWVRTGYVGLILFLYILFVSFRMCWHCIRWGTDAFITGWGVCLASVLMTLIIIGFFEPFFSHTIEVLFYTVLGMTAAIWHINTRYNVTASD